MCESSKSSQILKCFKVLSCKLFVFLKAQGSKLSFKTYNFRALRHVMHTLKSQVPKKADFPKHDKLASSPTSSHTLTLIDLSISNKSNLLTNDYTTL